MIAPTWGGEEARKHLIFDSVLDPGPESSSDAVT